MEIHVRRRIRQWLHCLPGEVCIVLHYCASVSLESPSVHLAHSHVGRRESWSYCRRLPIALSVPIVPRWLQNHHARSRRASFSSSSSERTSNTFSRLSVLSSSPAKKPLNHQHHSPFRREPPSSQQQWRKPAQPRSRRTTCAERSSTPSKAAAASPHRERRRFIGSRAPTGPRPRWPSRRERALARRRRKRPPKQHP